MMSVEATRRSGHSGALFANHSSGATGTMVGAIGSAFAAGATSERTGAVVLGSPPSVPSRAWWAGWGGGAVSLAAALVRSAGRVRGSGRPGRMDALLLTDPELPRPYVWYVAGRGRRTL